MNAGTRFLRSAGLTSVVLSMIALAALVLPGLSRTDNAHVAGPMIGNSQAAAPVATVYPTVALHSPTPDAQPAEAVPHVEEVAYRDFGPWSYRAYRGTSPGQGIAAVVSYDRSSVRGLQAYSTANRALAAAFRSRDGVVKTDITFRNYVALDQFREWALARGVRVEHVDIRTLDAAGRPGTISLAGRDEDPLPAAEVQQALASVRDSVGLSEVKGVYFASVTVDASRLASVATDSLVFLVDLTPYSVRGEVLSRVAGITESQIRVDVPHPFWDMEKLGLANFTR